MRDCRQVVGFARVSSREQAENSHALEQQIARLESEGVSTIYVDVQSGTKSINHRPGLKQLLSDIRRGEIHSVVITRLDRFARMSPSGLWKIMNLLEEKNVTLRALDQSLDFNSAAGRFQINVLASVASYFVDDLSERVRHGWSHLRDRRIAMHPPFGYKKSEDRHELDYSPFLCLIETQEEKSKAEIARHLIDLFFEHRSAGLALQKMNQFYGIQNFANAAKGGGVTARHLFRFSKPGFCNWLLNPVLQGHLVYLRKTDRKITIYNTHPEHRLINEEEVEEIEKIFAQNRLYKGYTSTALKYPLSGLVFCANCRFACYSCSGTRGKTPGRNYYFQCKNWKVRGCSNKTMTRMEKVEAILVQALVARSRELALLALQPSPPTEDSIEIKKLLDQITVLQGLGENPAIQQAILQLETQVQNLRFAGIEKTSFNENYVHLLQEAFSDPDCWLENDPQERGQIYRELVDKIFVLNGEVAEICLKI